MTSRNPPVPHHSSILANEAYAFMNVIPSLSLSLSFYTFDRRRAVTKSNLYIFVKSSFFPQTMGNFKSQVSSMLMKDMSLTLRFISAIVCEVANSVMSGDQDHDHSQRLFESFNPGFSDLFLKMTTLQYDLCIICQKKTDESEKYPCRADGSSVESTTRVFQVRNKIL